MQYIVAAADLDDTLQGLLGNCSTEPSDGRINRTLPLAHPRFDWLFAERVSSIRGRGTHTVLASDISGALEVPPVPTYAEYAQYLVTVEFTPRPYAVLKNESIEKNSLTWVGADGNTVTVANAAQEYLRYTEWMEEPITEVITAQNGSLKFSTSAGDPNSIPIPGGPQMRAPRKKVICRWHQVPYRYVTSSNSYLTRYAGHINQYGFINYSIGHILYEGCRVVKLAPPPFPSRIETVAGNSTRSIEKLATLELQFEYVQRTQTNVPSPSNGNHITAGHNLMPWFKDRAFYYVVSQDASATPTFASADLAVLFSDPDAQG